MRCFSSVIQFLRHLLHLFLLVRSLCTFFLVPGFSFLVSQPSLWRCTMVADNSVPIWAHSPTSMNFLTLHICPLSHHNTGTSQFWFPPTLLSPEGGKREQPSSVIAESSLASADWERYSQIPGTSATYTHREMRNTHLLALSGY